MIADEFDDIRLAVRRYVRDEVVPLEAEIEERDEIPERVRKTAAEMGLFGFALPEEYGGLGPVDGAGGPAGLRARLHDPVVPLDVRYQQRDRRPRADAVGATTSRRPRTCRRWRRGSGPRRSR